MKRYFCIIAVLFLFIEGMSLASVEVSNPREIMGGSVILRPNMRTEFCARLSPDGKYILFPQQVSDVENTYRLFLQNIETANRIEIPIDLPSGYETLFTRFNFFNPEGDKLALFSINREQNSTITKIVFFDITSKTLTNTGIKSNSSMAQYDFTGNRLVISNNNVVFLTSLNDFNPGKAVMSGWVHSCSPQSPFAAIFVPPNPSRNQTEFKLLNLDTSDISDLPVHNNNKRLDDITSQWSSDGSYLFYLDVKDDSSDSLEVVTRVWDINTNKEKAIIPNTLCLGPGPANNLMIMISTENNSSGSNLYSYDLKTGGLSTIGDGSIKGIHAWKNRIVYSKTENGVGTICTADLKIEEDNN